ncbi:MAG: hypothetical protein QOJ07_3624 [Thermoleophilaceae bacterium]|nr:hypothetical protein [Thermoleophilaceae bacterium]
MSSYGGLGGSELATADFLAHRPPGVDARALLVSGGALEDVLVQHDVPTRVAEGFEGKPGRAEITRFGRGLGPLLRNERPDVIWAVGQKAALLASAPARAARIPLVWHKVDFSWDRQLGRPLVAAARGLIASSHAVVEPLGRAGRRKLIDVVWPPLRLEGHVEPRFDPAAPAIGIVGRLVPYKGAHHVIRAGALLADEFPSLRIVIAGGSAPQYPDYPDSLRALAAELGISDRVDLLGHVGDVRPVLEGLTVFMSATYRDDEGFGLEGLGAGILEASWAGLPVVVARAGGTVETLEDGVTGTLVDAPEPEALAAAAAPYLRDAELARAAGAAGRAFVERSGIAPEQAARRLFAALATVA